jgi:hypothetical protein
MVHGKRRRKTGWPAPLTAATFRKTVRGNEEVVPVNVSTWVLLFGVAVGR